MATENGGYADYLDLSPSSWKRPEGPPRNWRVIDGRRKTANGDIPKFSIQEVSEELVDDVLDFKLKYFVRDEPLSISRGLGKDPQALRELRSLWRYILRQGVSIVALTVNSDPSAKPVIAGANILNVVTAEDEDGGSRMLTSLRTTCMKIILGVQQELVEEVNIFAKYGIDKYLAASGLSVDPFFRGQGLGEELLRIRNDIGVAYQIPVSETAFTATTSQVLASRVGFEVLLERKYSELFDDEGKLLFPGVKTEALKIMGKRLY